MRRAVCLLAGAPGMVRKADSCAAALAVTKVVVRRLVGLVFVELCCRPCSCMHAVICVRCALELR